MAIGKDLEFAKSFAEKAKEDLSSAEILLGKGNFSDSVYHSQQCSEKIVKALLILENRFVRDHIVSPLFADVAQKVKLKGAEDILRNLKFLEEHWVKPRYPEISEMEVWNPARKYKKEDAMDAIKRARLVFEALSAILKERYGVSYETKK